VTAVGDPAATESYKRILSILDSKDKIPGITRIGNDGWYYNFWRDETHVQGIWRKTTLESYRSAAPEWQTVIDVDALPPPTVDTAATWVWHSYSLLDEGPGGAWDRALISLSPGGSDADTTREFDMVNEAFIEPEAGGFALPKAAKTRIGYRARDEVLVGTDFEGDGVTLTDSGYPRVVKSWRRGTPLSEATTVFEGEQTDIAANQYAYYDRGFHHEFQKRSITFYTSKTWYRAPADFSVPAPDETAAFEPVPVPDDVTFRTFADSALIELRTEWCPPGCEETFPAGSLLAAPMAEVMQADFSNVTTLFVPTDAASLSSQSGTKDYLVLKVLEDVRTVLRFWRYESGGVWADVTAPPSEEGGAVAVGQDVSVSAIWPDEDNGMWLWRDGFLVPDVLELANAEDGCISTEVLKSKPAMFTSEGLTVHQYFATSLDGTKIPYFVICRADMALDGTNATLLDAYGGFEISMLPYYSAGVGAGWLERGGVKVIANIRGGGEYGPKWHQAALKEHRHKGFEDVEAVAADLIERNITSRPKLAVIGGSNGGLMVGNMITRPVASRLFGAAVCQVPLLDMKRYSHLLAGASWMAEYGNPDTDEWAFLRKHSAYQLLRHDCLGLPGKELEEGTPAGGRAAAEAAEERWTCPKVLFTTSTRDDRVHPGHARKMVCSLLEEAPPAAAPCVLYWENTEGGHGGAADNKQRAYMWSLSYEFLDKALGIGGASL